MAANDQEIPGAHGLTFDQVMTKAYEVVDRLIHEQDLLNGPNRSGAEISKLGETVNREVHFTYRQLPRDLWIVIAMAVTSEQSPGWAKVDLRLERREKLDERPYQWGIQFR